VQRFEIGIEDQEESRREDRRQKVYPLQIGYETNGAPTIVSGGTGRLTIRSTGQKSVKALVLTESQEKRTSNQCRNQERIPLPVTTVWPSGHWKNRQKYHQGRGSFGVGALREPLAGDIVVLTPPEEALLLAAI
jgi:hypothetical protein